MFVDLRILHAVRMHHILVCGLPPVQYFSTLYHKRHDFREKKFIEHKMCVLISCKTVETVFILRAIERDMIKNWSSCAVPVILVRF